jgi:hypothetical protein
MACNVSFHGMERSFILAATASNHVQTAPNARLDREFSPKEVVVETVRSRHSSGGERSPRRCLVGMQRRVLRQSHHGEDLDEMWLQAERLNLLPALGSRDH